MTSSLSDVISQTEQATEAETEEKEQEQVAADPIVECLPVGARTALELVDTNDVSICPHT